MASTTKTMVISKTVNIQAIHGVNAIKSIIIMATQITASIITIIVKIPHKTIPSPIAIESIMKNIAPTIPAKMRHIEIPIPEIKHIMVSNNAMEIIRHRNPAQPKVNIANANANIVNPNRHRSIAVTIPVAPTQIIESERHRTAKAKNVIVRARQIIHKAKNGIEVHITHNRALRKNAREQRKHALADRHKVRRASTRAVKPRQVTTNPMIIQINPPHGSRQHPKKDMHIPKSSMHIPRAIIANESTAHANERQIIESPITTQISPPHGSIQHPKKNIHTPKKNISNAKDIAVNESTAHANERHIIINPKTMQVNPTNGRRQHPNKHIHSPKAIIVNERTTQDNERHIMQRQNVIIRQIEAKTPQINITVVIPKHRINKARANVVSPHKTTDRAKQATSKLHGSVNAHNAPNTQARQMMDSERTIPSVPKTNNERNRAGKQTTREQIQDRMNTMRQTKAVMKQTDPIRQDIPHIIMVNTDRQAQRTDRRAPDTQRIIETTNRQEQTKQVASNEAIEIQAIMHIIPTQKANNPPSINPATHNSMQRNHPIQQRATTNSSTSRVQIQQAQRSISGRNRSIWAIKQTMTKNRDNAHRPSPIIAVMKQIPAMAMAKSNATARHGPQRQESIIQGIESINSIPQSIASAVKKSYKRPQIGNKIIVGSQIQIVITIPITRATKADMITKNPGSAPAINTRKTNNKQ